MLHHVSTGNNIVIWPFLSAKIYKNVYVLFCVRSFKILAQ